MSHFTVLVVGDDPEGQLDPFNEQPPEGSPYLQFNDCHDEVLEAWENETVECVQLRNERWVPKWSTEGRMVKGSMEVSKPVKEVYKDIHDFATNYHGYSMQGARYGYMANPDAKWDWYQLGGRWRGSFLLKPQCEYQAVVGGPGVFNNEAEPGTADQCMKRDIDIEQMRENARAEAEAEYDRFEKAVAGLEPLAVHWPTLRDQADSIEEAREIYHNNLWVKAVREAGFESFMGPCYYEMFYVNKGGREAYVKNAIESAFTTFAVLMDGEWYERGSMGWWGIVTDEANDEDWNAQFHKLFDSLPDDTLLSVYDCHI